MACTCHRYEHHVPGIPPTIQVRPGCPVHCPDDSAAANINRILFEDPKAGRLAAAGPELLAALKRTVAADDANGAAPFIVDDAARALIARLEGK